MNYSYKTEGIEIRNIFIAFILVLFFAITLTMAESFQADRTRSSIKFKIKCLLVGNVTGGFNHFSGRFDLAKGKLKSFSAKCYTDTVHTGNSKRDINLKAASFFNVAKYPKMTLQMTGRKKEKILIKLTIKGITKKVLFDYRPVKEMNNLQKNHHTGFSLSGTIRLKDFDLDLYNTLGAGSMIFGKTVKIIARIEGSKSSLFDR